jgi:hypothetical protein
LLARNKKNSSALLLLVLVLSPSVILFTNLSQQYWVAHQMMEKLETANAQRFVFPLQQLVWVEAEKEILVNGQLIDVQAYEIANDSIWVTGLYDKEETQLKNELSALLSKKNGKQQGLALLKLMCCWYLPHTSKPALLHDKSNILLYFFEETAAFRYLPVAHPPPNC